MKLYSLLIIFLSVSGIAFSMDAPKSLGYKIKSFTFENGETISDVRALIRPEYVDQVKVLDYLFAKETYTINDKKNLINRMAKFIENKEQIDNLNHLLKVHLIKDMPAKEKYRSPLNAKRRLF